MLCDRTREWAALRLDGELSEFERVLMRAHLERCAECRSFAADVTEITQQLREAPLERLPQPVTLPQRRRVASFRHVQVAAAAAVVVAAAGLGGLYGAVRNSPQEAGPVAAATSLAAVSEDRLVRTVQLAYLKREPRTPSLGETKPLLPISI
jgi:predicted anti-sigma-YlaC factor YlaD